MINPPKRVVVADPIIIPKKGRYGEEQEITDVLVSIERDITIFYGKEETGEYVAMLPVKITYKRNVDSTSERIVKKINHE